MKRGNEEERRNQINGMFSKRHQTPTSSHLHSSTVTRFLPTAEEEEEDRHSQSPTQYSAGGMADGNHSLFTPSSNDGATIEVIRRPRGRPPGSKNKQKQSPVTTKEFSEPSLRPYILELPAGVDIIEATTHFCRKRNIGLCILSGNGAVSNVTLKQPSATPGATVTFHGRFDILSISATVLASGAGFGGDGSFTISVGVGPQGQMVGGVVVGPLISAATIYLIGGTFNNPSFFKLQLETENGGGEDQHDSPAGGVAERCGVGSLYSYDQSTEVMWSPNARQAHASYD